MKTEPYHLFVYKSMIFFNIKFSYTENFWQNDIFAPEKYELCE